MSKSETKRLKVLRHNRKIVMKHPEKVLPHALPAAIDYYNSEIAKLERR